MHERIADLSRPQTLDDLLAETEAMSFEGAVEGRRVFTAADLDEFPGAAGVVEVIDGTRGPRVRIPSPPRVVKSISLEVAATAGDADDHQPTLDEIDAERERQRRRRTGEDAAEWANLSPQEQNRRRYEGVEECAAGTRVSGPKRNDRGPRSRRKDVGESIDDEHWESRRGGRPRTGKQRPALVGGRVTHETKDALDADKTASNGEILDRSVS